MARLGSPAFIAVMQSTASGNSTPLPSSGGCTLRVVRAIPTGIDPRDSSASDVYGGSAGRTKT